MAVAPRSTATTTRSHASVRSLPGVSFVSTATTVPFGQIVFRDVFIQKELGDRGPQNPQVPVNIVSADFEHALGVPLLGGRSFTRQDDSSSVKVVMVNRALADRYYSGNAVGKLINWNGENWEIVGMVGSAVLESLDSPPEPMLFISEPQAPRTARFVLVRSTRNPADLLVEIRGRMRQIDPTIAMTSIATMDDRLSTSLAAQRFRATLVGGLCLLAIVLSIVGHLWSRVIRRRRADARDRHSHGARRERDARARRGHRVRAPDRRDRRDRRRRCGRDGQPVAGAVRGGRDRVERPGSDRGDVCRVRHCRRRRPSCPPAGPAGWIRSTRCEPNSALRAVGIVRPVVPS